jgi:hypothetical protein
VQASALHLTITIQKQLKLGNDATTSGAGTHGQVQQEHMSGTGRPRKKKYA